MGDAVVKLDSELKEEVEKYISTRDNRFEYPSVKNFVDKAVLSMLKRLKRDKK